MTALAALAGPDDATGSPPRDFHRRWPSLRPPLRPTTATAAQIAGLLADCIDPLLLLGVTPELAAIERDVIALDWNPAMIDLAWPGDDARHHALLGDWKAMPLGDASVGGALSDGAITMLAWPGDAQRVFGELARTVRPAGRIVLRCFATSEPFESAAAVCADALAGGTEFHAFKLRFNMAVAREDGGIAVASARLFERFGQCFPDRAALAEAAGWSLETIAEIDAYAGSAYIHCYPTRAELAGLLADWPGRWRFEETMGYPLADHCPLLVIDRA